MLKAITSDGLLIEITFKGFDADCIYLSGHEMNVLSDEYKGLYVNFGDGLDMNIVPVSAVIDEAENRIVRIVRETEFEIRDWDNHVRACMSASRYI